MNVVEKPNFYTTKGGAALSYPQLLAQALRARENQFQGGIRATPWFKEFQQQYGEQPDLSSAANYDYRKAWAAGLRPTQDPYDQNRYHWPSALPSGELLKSATHPTAWKEEYMRATGQNPDAVGITLEQWKLMQGIK